MHIGTTLYLTIQDPSRDKPTKFRSKIIEKNADYLFIDYPISSETDKTSIIPIGTKLTASYLGDDDHLCLFQTVIRKRTYLNMPALVLERPTQEAIKIVQRREHVRVKTVIDVAVHCPDNSFSPFTTVTIDISGGGLSFITPKEITLQPKQQIIIWIVLPMNSGEIKYFELKSEIIRSTHNETDIRSTSVKFISLPHTIEEQIIQFCFEKQIEARKQLWI